MLCFNNTDGVGGFGIIEPKDPVAEGDDIDLICAASVYNYTNNFEWKYTNSTNNTNGTPIKQNSKYLRFVSRFEENNDF